MSLTPPAFLDKLRQHRLLDESQLTQVLSDLGSRFTDSAELAQDLQSRGLLTRFQVERVLNDKGGELVLGPYVLVDLLGEGGMGQVYKAYHRLLKSVRAIKVIKPEALTSKHAVERFLREAQAVARLNHPNIITAHDANQEGDTIYFVMEFAPGQDLGHLVKARGPLPPGAAAEYIRQACLGLQ